MMLIPLSLAQPRCPAALGDAEVLPAAMASWEEAHAAGQAELLAQQARAAGQVPALSLGLSLSGQRETRATIPDQAEQSGTAALTLQLSRQAHLSRQAIRSATASLQGELAAEQWDFLESTLEVWLHWRSAAREEAHLIEYLEESSAWLEPLRVGESQQQVSRLERADMEAELGRVQIELSTLRAYTAAAAGELQGLLGGCAVAPPGALALEADPWAPVVALSDAHPHIQQLRAEAEAAEAAARASRATRALGVQLGVTTRSIGGQEEYTGPIVTLTVPLQRGGSLSTAQQAAEAQRLPVHADWLAQQIAVQLRALQASHQAMQAEQASLEADYLAPLAARLALTEAAFAQSQLALADLIRARRDLHEAEHELLRLRLALEASVLRAHALRQLLTSLSMESSHATR